MMKSIYGPFRRIPSRPMKRRLWELDRFFHDEALSIFTTQRILTVVTHKSVTLPIPLNGNFYYGTFDKAEVN